jgi:anaerobic selenocysteine-containing dehydrogenase
MDVLYLVGADPLADCPDRVLALQALQKARFVVAIDAFATESVAHADVVLPAAIYTERRGSFTNIEGRLTWLAQKVTAPGTARPDWMIAIELASRLGADLGAGSLEDLWAEIEAVSPLHAGVTSARLTSRQSRDGVVVPLGLEARPPGAAEVPSPLDPMADPGIASAEIHPAPPVSLSVVGAGVDRTEDGVDHVDAPAPASGMPVPLRLVPPPVAAAGRATSSGTATATSSATARATSPSSNGDGGGGSPVRLVTSRPMWDGGVLVQRSPSLAALHPALALALSPADLARLAPATAGMVRVTTSRGSLEVAVVEDATVPVGTAVLPFNLPGGGAGALIDAAAPFTELTVGPVSAP